MLGDNIEERRGRGRPRKEGTFDHVVKVRLSDAELELLEEMEYETGMSKAELMREAIHRLHNIKIGWKRA